MLELKISLLKIRNFYQISTILRQKFAMTKVLNVMIIFWPDIEL